MNLAFSPWILGLCHHPNWRSRIFFRGVKKAPSSVLLFGEMRKNCHCIHQSRCFFWPETYIITTHLVVCCFFLGMKNPYYLLLSKSATWAWKSGCCLGFDRNSGKWIKMLFTEVERYSTRIPTVAKTLHAGPWISNHFLGLQCQRTLFFIQWCQRPRVSFLRVGCSTLIWYAVLRFV